jgi:hypothetical protein
MDINMVCLLFGFYLALGPGGCEASNGFELTLPAEKSLILSLSKDDPRMTARASTGSA